jgi:hypothetical protein
MDAFIAAGWSPNALMNALSPVAISEKVEDGSPKPVISENSHPNVFPDFLSEAGWSPNALLAAISPLPTRRFSSKRCKKWETPDSTNVAHQRKTADTKKTPSPNALAAQSHVIDLTSPVNNPSSDCEIFLLSSQLAAQSISSFSAVAEPPARLVTQPKFQTAKKLFDDDNLMHSQPTSISTNSTVIKEDTNVKM